MIKKFEIFVASEYLDEIEQKIAIRVLSNFYYGITPKHQKVIQINWSTKGVEPSIFIQKEIDNYDLPRKIIHFSTATNRISFNSSRILFHPSTKNLKRIFPEALSKSLAIVTRYEENVDEYITVKSGIAIDFETQEQLVEDFRKTIEMLYFDQEVLKLMQKGALEHYEENFGWGLKEFRRNSSK